MGRELRYSFLNGFGIKRWIYLHSCSSDCSNDLRRWLPSLSVYCNVDCRLELERKCPLLHECNVTERRGGKKKSELESLVSAEFSESQPEFKHTCCVSIQGLHHSKDSAFAVFEGESFGETLLTASVVVKWDGLAFEAFPGCITRCFTPAKVTIYAMRCRHFLFFFLIFQACILQKEGKRRLHLEEPSDWDSLLAA